MSRSHFFMWVVLCASNLIVTTPTTTSIHDVICNVHERRQVALYVFGDSLFDVGNNNYLENAAVKANRFPYGQTFFNHSTGRFSSGRNMVDFIAEYLKLPLIPPYLLPGYQQFMVGANFASGGAGALAETFQGLVIDLKTQLHYFKDVETKLIQSIGDEKTKSVFGKTLFIFSIGNNDYIAPFYTHSTVFQSFTKEEFVGKVIGNITTVLKEIYKSGGRKFGLLNTVPLGCTPFLKALVQNQTGDGCLEEANVLVKLHNTELPKAIRKLHMLLKGFEYSIFDLAATLGERMQNPSKYGFKEGHNMACCGSGPYRGLASCGGNFGYTNYELCENPEECVFFDSIHPTDKANYQLAKLMWNGDSCVSNPQNLKSLVNLRN